MVPSQYTGVTIERKGNDYYVSGRFDKDQFVEINAVAPDSTGAVRTIWKGSAKSFDKLLSYHFIDTSKSKAVEVMVIHQESDSAPAYGFRRRFK